ncbi:MAG: hypothetical protein ACK5V3_17300 [Bdellovibrionales bacterium]
MKHLFNYFLLVAISIAANTASSSDESIGMTLQNKIPLPGRVMSVEGQVVVKKISQRSNKDPDRFADFIYTYNVETGHRSTPVEVPQYDRIYSEAPAHGPLLKILLQPEGSLMLMITDLEYLVFDYMTGKLVKKLDAVTDSRFDSSANQPSWSKSGRYLAFTDKNNRVLKIYDSLTGATRTINSNLLVSMRQLRWSPDESKLLYVEGDSKVNQYDLKTGQSSQLLGSLNRSGPIFYAHWLNENTIRVGNNFYQEYYSVEPYKLIGSAESGSNTDLFRGLGRVKDAKGHPSTYSNLNISWEGRDNNPLLWHPELKDNPTRQYEALPGGIYLFSHGRGDKYYFVDSNSRVLFETAQANMWGDKGVRYRSFISLGDKLVAVTESGLEYFNISGGMACRAKVKK